jgi:hypothetical protein
VDAALPMLANIALTANPIAARARRRFFSLQFMESFAWCLMYAWKRAAGKRYRTDCQ